MQFRPFYTIRPRIYIDALCRAMVTCYKRHEIEHQFSKDPIPRLGEAAYGIDGCLHSFSQAR